MELQSPMNQTIRVKFIIHGIVHEEAFNGPCRWGNLENLTMEAEQKALQKAYNDFLDKIDSLTLPPVAVLLEPVTINLWVEKENPEIMLQESQLEKLDSDSKDVDLFVVLGGGAPQFTCLNIARRYKKPVAMINDGHNGWGVDMPAGLRHEGLEGYFLANWDELSRLVKALYVRKCFQNTTILMLTETNFGKQPVGVVSVLTDYAALKQRYGVSIRQIGYDEFFSEMERLSAQDETVTRAGNIIDTLIGNAEWIEMEREDIFPSIIFYLTARHFLEKYECNAFTAECFEMCSSMIPWKKRFTPCLAHSLLKDEGIPSACEADLNALLAMMIEMFTQGKAVKMGNPDLDIENDTLTITHDVSSLKMHGYENPDCVYGIKNFTSAGFGATIRYDFKRDKNAVMTVGRFDPFGEKILVTRGKLVDGEGYHEVGCSEGLVLKIDDAKGFFKAQSDFGHHLSVVFGDAIDDIRYCGKVMGFSVVEA